MTSKIFLLSVHLTLLMHASGCANLLEDILGKGGARRSSTVAIDDIRWLTLEDPDCQATGTSVAPQTVTTYIWDGAAIKTSSGSLNGIVSPSGHFISSKILGSILNAEWAESCTVSASKDIDCQPAKTDKEKGTGLLKICRADGNYKRDSIEAMVLTSQHLLEDSFKYYDGIDGNKTGLANAYIIAQLKLRKDFKLPDGRSKTLYESDNAAFQSFSEEHSSPLFHLYPTSTLEFSKSGVNLWEVPFVIRHEFAHHVLDHYVSGSMAMHGLSFRPRYSSHHHSILPRDHGRPKDLMLLEGAVAEMAIDGINEAFADLYAYFQSGASSDQVKGVPCMDISRDPGSPMTKGGTPKGLTLSQVAVYEGRTAAQQVTSCYEPTYDEEHDIALALGYPLAQFLKTSVGVDNRLGGSKALLLWAGRMNNLIGSNISSVSLDTLVRELVLAVKTDMSKNIGDACSGLKPQITGLPLTTNACQ